MGNRQRQKRRGKDALRAEMARRQRLRQGGLLALSLLVAGLVGLKLLDDRPEPASPNVAASYAGGPVSLVFADFTPGEDATVARFGIEDGVEEEIAKLPRSSTTTASLTSDWLTVVELADRGGVEVPMLYLFAPASGDETEIGPGVAPSWKADGTAIAYAEPVDFERCNLVDCPGDKRIVVLDPATGNSETLIEGSYQILFWAGDHLLVFDTETQGDTISLGTDGSERLIDIHSARIWGASPDGKWLLVSTGDGIRFVRLSEEGEPREETKVDLPPETALGPGGWAFDSSAVAVVIEDIAAPRVVTFSPSEPEPHVLGEGVGSITRVLWSPANDGVFLSTVNQGIGGVYCPLDAECESLDFNGESRLPLRLE